MPSTHHTIGVGLLIITSTLAGTSLAQAEPSPPDVVKAIQPKINAAIDRGVLRLLRLQQSDGSWALHEQQYQGGMTALALYTLLRSGVPPTHPAVVRGLARLYAWDPQETYSVACELLALEATQDPKHLERMKLLTERLVSWQRAGWGYPYEHQGGGVWNRRFGRPDLSNMQFAAMGLRAALHAGLEVPPKAFLDLIRETRFHQERAADSALFDERGTAREMAGFGYTGPSAVGGRSAPTGSMTCAGIAILALSRQALGRKAKPKLVQQIEASTAHALTWLEQLWTVTMNPRAKASHKFYYLYGLERVGSLLETESIGTHHWYAEGAQELLATQKDDGSWAGDPQTCFALLFLVRATGQGTGKPPIASVLGRYAMDDPASPVRFRAEGHSPLTLWITSFGAEVGRKHGSGDVVNGLRVERVEYVVDGDVAATARGEPGRPWRNETFRVFHHFAGPGEFEVRVRVHLVAADAAIDWTQPAVVIESLPLPVTVAALWPSWSERGAHWSSRNLMPAPVTATASTFHHDYQGPGRAVDGVLDGFWLCDPADPRPTLRLKLPKAAKANVVVLHPPESREDQRRSFDRAMRVELRVNGKGTPLAYWMDPDSSRPTALRLPKPIRIKRLDLAIVDRLPTVHWVGQAGFSEVSLELDPVDPPRFTRDDQGLVTLSCEAEDATIHYTLDGATPTPDSPRYQTPFARPEATRLQAIARVPTGETSRMLVADLPVREGFVSLDRRQWKILHVDSEQEPRGPVRLAFDGDPFTHWHTKWRSSVDPLPHEFVIDLGETFVIEGFTYLARREGTNGNVKDWLFYVSDDPKAWGPAIGTGTFANVKGRQQGTLVGTAAGRYVRFVATSETGGHAFTACAEFDLQARRP